MSVQRILLRIRCDNGDALRVKTRPAGEYFRDGGVGVQLGIFEDIECKHLFWGWVRKNETDSIIDKY